MDRRGGETLSLDRNSFVKAVGENDKSLFATIFYLNCRRCSGVRRALYRRDLFETVRDNLEDSRPRPTVWHVRSKGLVAGDIQRLAFHPTENLGALGNAGEVVTNDRKLAEHVDRLRSYGWREQFHQVVPFGRNARMDEIQAAVLCAKLEYVDQWNGERRQIQARYAAACGVDAKIVGSNDPTNACHLAVLRTPHRSIATRLMSEAGIVTRIHYPVLDCDHISETGLPGRKLPLPQSERARDEILSLPCYPCLSDLEIEHVVRALAVLSGFAR